MSELFPSVPDRHFFLERIYADFMHECSRLVFDGDYGAMILGIAEAALYSASFQSIDPSEPHTSVGRKIVELVDRLQTLHNLTHGERNQMLGRLLERVAGQEVSIEQELSTQDSNGRSLD